MRNLRGWILLAALLFVAVPAPADDARGMLWRVSDTVGNFAYLAGTVHAVAPDFYPLPATIMAAFQASEVLVLEVNPTRVTPAEITRITINHGFYTPPHSLSRTLPDPTWRLAQDWGKRHGVSRGQLERMRPWLAAITFVALEMKRLGYDPQLGLERHFVGKVRESGHEIGELETMEEQVGFLSGLSPALQLRFLTETLEDAEGVAETAERIIGIWRRGDLAAMDALLAETYAEEEELYEAMLRSRNHRWLPRIESKIGSGRLHFIAVGALHMAGPDGLVALLESKGYRLEQL